MSGRLFFLLILLSLSLPCSAEESVDPSDTPATQAIETPHPIYSDDANWAAKLIVAIAGLFLAAAVIGPIVRAEAPQAVPDAMSHEEDPAVDRH